MPENRPIIGITMGDPVGIGPEILLTALDKSRVYDICMPVVIGDSAYLEKLSSTFGFKFNFKIIDKPEEGNFEKGTLNIINQSNLDTDTLEWGKPTHESGRAMADYILKGIELASSKRISALTTGPINKLSLNLSGYHYNGHTEILAEKTKTTNYKMMLAGERLKVVLVTIHIPLKDAPESITPDNILETITITETSLRNRFGLLKPKIAVAALNPHAGEGGMFGDEEEKIIQPAISMAKKLGIDADGPFPPDTVFYNAKNGAYDAVVCMYHDQGLIPFKMIHFEDGVNTTLGLPIIRTSVDHGTAYEIAGKGIASPESLIAAIKMAAAQCRNLE